MFELGCTLLLQQCAISTPTLLVHSTILHISTLSIADVPLSTSSQRSIYTLSRLPRRPPINTPNNNHKDDEPERSTAQLLTTLQLPPPFPTWCDIPPIPSIAVQHRMALIIRIWQERIVMSQRGMLVVRAVVLHWNVCWWRHGRRVIGSKSVSHCGLCGVAGEQAHLYQ